MSLQTDWKNITLAYLEFSKTSKCIFFEVMSAGTGKKETSAKSHLTHYGVKYCKVDKIDLETSAMTEFSRSTGRAQRSEVKRMHAWSGLKSGALNSQLQ